MDVDERLTLRGFAAGFDWPKYHHIAPAISATTSAMATTQPMPSFIPDLSMPNIVKRLLQ